MGTDVHHSVKADLLTALVVDGDTLAIAAENHRLTYEQALDVVSRYGYPNLPSMERALARLMEATDSTEERAVPRHGTAPPPPKEDVMPDTNGDTPTPREARPSRQEDDADLDLVPALLVAAGKSQRVRVQQRAERVRTDLQWLRERVVEERAEARNAARIAELEAELDRLRGRTTRPAKKPSGIGGVVRISVRCVLAQCEHEPMDSLQGLNLHRRRAHEAGPLNGATIQESNEVEVLVWPSTT